MKHLMTFADAASDAAVILSVKDNLIYQMSAGYCGTFDEVTIYQKDEESFRQLNLAEVVDCDDEEYGEIEEQIVECSDEHEKDWIVCNEWGDNVEKLIEESVKNFYQI